MSFIKFNSNYRPILHPFRDTAIMRRKFPKLL